MRTVRWHIDMPPIAGQINDNREQIEDVFLEAWRSDSNQLDSS
jgi:hypothetical protein